MYGTLSYATDSYFVPSDDDIPSQREVHTVGVENKTNDPLEGPQITCNFKVMPKIKVLMVKLYGGISSGFNAIMTESLHTRFYFTFFF